jgi:hypothetical protein
MVKTNSFLHFQQVLVYFSNSAEMDTVSMEARDIFNDQKNCLESISKEKEKIGDLYYKLQQLKAQL